MQIMAFDFGEARTGVAIGQTVTATATALATIATPRKQHWHEVDGLVNEWQPDAFLVGLPLQLGGEESQISKAARKFANRLHARYGKRVHMIDERMSSLEAERNFREQRAGGAARRNKKDRIDAHAARIILETWLTQQA